MREHAPCAWRQHFQGEFCGWARFYAALVDCRIYQWLRVQSQGFSAPCVSRQGFQGEFLWPGTSDLGAWLAVPAALRVWRAIGAGRLRRHNHSLLLEAVALLTRSFGTQDVIGACPLSLLGPLPE